MAVPIRYAFWPLDTGQIWWPHLPNSAVKGPDRSIMIMKLCIASYGMIDHDRPIGTYHGRVWEMRPSCLAGVQWLGCIPNRNSHQ